MRQTAVVCRFLFFFCCKCNSFYYFSQKYIIMNEHLIGKDSEIKGKLNSYLPDDVIYLSDKIDKPFLNCVVVFSYLNLTRYNFEAKFYSKFTQINFDSSKRHHFCFILYTTKEDSEAIIEDIKNGEFFTQ